MQAFIAQAASLELEAERTYRRLADCLLAHGKRDAGDFFLEMANFSRLHRESIVGRGGLPDGETPHARAAAACATNETEVPDWSAITEECDLDGAMKLALASEHRGVVFYESFARAASDPAVRSLAEDCAREERGHVLALERFMGIKPY